MAGKPQYTAADFIGAMPGSGGIIATIAKRVGCDWQTAKKYITQYPTVARAYEDECETVSDMAESVLIKSIQEGNTQDAKWWLARKRRDEFSERHELTGADGGAIETKSEHEHLIRDATATERRILGRMDSIATRIGTVAVDRPHSTNGTG